MDPSVNADRIAVMIDADNTSHTYASEVLSEVAKYGNPTIKRVYGDWSNTHLTRWARKLNSLGLRAMHQNAFTKGKNSTDLALVIDAMDLLYDGNVEAFALVTSDSDFTSLAHRLRESGKTVYVLGTQKAPDALKYACDKFIELEFLEADEEDEASDEDQDARPTPPINLQSAITRAVNAVSDDEGWATLSALGSQLNRTHPSFDARTFGHARLSSLVQDQPYLETAGTGGGTRIRLKGQSAGRTATTKAAAKKAPEKKAPEKKAPAKKAAAKKAAADKAAAEKAAAEPEKAPEPPRPVVTKRTRTSAPRPARTP